MNELPAAGTFDLLQHFHESLGAHFADLRDRRARLASAAPVFALEHDLTEADLTLLQDAVRRSIAAGAPAAHRRQWLPFVVHATEIGYGYEGHEYWDTFARETRGWEDSNRHWFKAWFTKFAEEFAGAKPRGAWASNFTIIAWPITHAVLPTYLQRQCAQLLYEFRTGLSLRLLEDPSELGVRLASRANGYSDRFRVFAQNTALLGQVAAALLSGDDEESPYLTGKTLDRVVAGLTQQRQAREWLRSARQRAGQIRASGFQSGGPTTRARTAERLPLATDPKLSLRRVGGVWRAHAELPDMTALSDRLPHLYEDLRTHRSKVSGRSRPLPRGGLVYAGQEIHFERWPDPQAPFVQLEDVDKPVNDLLADQCVITPGPWWLFQRRGDAFAIEVKGRFVRPGHRYILVGADVNAPDLPWCQPVDFDLDGATAYELVVPEPIAHTDRNNLENAGIASVSDVSIRPVGIVASSWDGEGLAEWIAGEPAIFEIRCTLTPDKCRLAVDDESFFFDWPPNTTASVLALRDLAPGPHELKVVLFRADGESLAKGSVAVLIREQASRPDGAETGEGIRMRAYPARPTLTELWDTTQPDSWREPASITIHGPPGTQAEFLVSLTDDRGEELTKIQREVSLPVDEDAWTDLAKWVRDQKEFTNHYDDSEGCVLSVHRDGLGFASLTCERGYRPLRWRFLTGHSRKMRATLSDRTDSGDTYSEFYATHDPMLAIRYDRAEIIDLPASGGLLRGVAADFEALAIAPTDPNSLFGAGDQPPTIPRLERNLDAVECLTKTSWMWASAALPADPFAASMQRKVLKAVEGTIAGLIGGNASKAVERKLASAEDPGDYLDELQSAVGTSTDHRRAAELIGRNLHKWTTSEDFTYGFGQCVKPILRKSGLPVELWNPSHLLAFAALPGTIMKLPDDQRTEYLRGILESPALLRAARFATVSNRVINNLDPAELSSA